MKYLRSVARLVIGLLFTFSGFVKVIDPVGAGVIFTEYFKAFHLHFLLPAALGCGVLLAVLELMLGMMILSGCRMRIATWAAMLFLGFFTLLTLYLAIFNPIQDCGCFGEFVKLTHWQTFAKNLVFLPIAVFLFFQRRYIRQFAPAVVEWLVVGIFAVSGLSLSWYCYRHLPITDVMGFAVGNDIKELLEDAREHPAKTYVTEVIYGKDGQTRAFDMDHLPDSTWTFVDSRTREMDTGVRHKITDFAVRDEADNYIGDSLLDHAGPYFVIPLADAVHLRKTEPGAFAAIAAYGLSQDIPVCVISGADLEESRAWMKAEGLDVPLYRTDFKTVLTMIRSNPGLMLFHRGYVTAKWAAADLPEVDTLRELLAQDPELTATQTAIDERLRMELILAVGILVLLFVPWLLRRLNSYSKAA